ncbi:MAG: hypothetical protein HY304_02105 [candidate division Zixibacteria bacterium]|nr:hypothetical protein [candidate division Zixibacteria bacterium]
MKSNDSPIGLCLSCRHVQRITSDRSSTFYLCTLSFADPRFAKYPSLPVRSCPGFEEISPDQADSDGAPRATTHLP